MAGWRRVALLLRRQFSQRLQPLLGVWKAVHLRWALVSIGEYLLFSALDEGRVGRDLRLAIDYRRLDFLRPDAELPTLVQLPTLLLEYGRYQLRRLLGILLHRRREHLALWDVAIGVRVLRRLLGFFDQPL
jgi:hypothetical protein